MASLSSISADLASKAIHLPQIYADYVTRNNNTVSQVEGSLRSLTYLLPGARFNDSELASESLLTFIQLLSIYHDHLLRNRADLLRMSPTLAKAQLSRLQTSKPSLHARYTMFWTNASSTYTRVATMLRVAEYTGLLWEMIAKKNGGERTRWRVVVFLESFKAFCRLVLMRLTNSRPIVTPPLPLREDFAPEEPDVPVSEEEMNMVNEIDTFDAKNAFGEAGVPTPPMSESEKVPITNVSEPFSMPRTGLTLPTLPTAQSVATYLQSHVLTPDDIKPARQLLHRLTSIQGQAAEVLYILRPVIYALLMQRMARTYGYEGTKWKKNWTPWLIALSIEYFSRQLAMNDLRNKSSGASRNGGGSALEAEELKKRGWNMAWWGMRGAFYENITKPWVQGCANKLKGKPLIDLVGVVIEDYEYLWSTYYFSTSTM